MDHRKYILMHKTEWDRLKKQAAPPEQPVPNKGLQSLIEQSQKWIKTWPDTVQGHVANVKKQKKQQHEKYIAMVKEYAKRKVQENTTQSIKEAREMIFQNSCYGKELHSALLESKVLEERNEQIKFKQKLKQKAVALEKEEETNNSVIKCYINDIGKYDNEITHLKKQQSIQVAEINKTAERNRKLKIAKEQEKEKQLEIEDTKLITQLQQLEKQNEKEYQQLYNEAVKEYEEDKKKIKDMRCKREEEEDARIEKWQKDQEVIQFKINCVYDKIKNGNQGTANYELIKTMQEEQNKSYDEFVNLGIDQLHKRITEKEQEDIEKQINQKKIRYKLAQDNRDISSKQQMLSKLSQCSCDRQTLINKPCRTQNKKLTECIEEKLSPSFLVPSNKLLEDLKRREKEPSPWSGLAASHAQFVDHAIKTLQESRYKNMARKVIRNYRRANCMNADTLPVPNF